ncbi:MAG: hypothetical protein R6X33_12915 [Candidatus Brocadiia bacterium]
MPSLAGNPDERLSLLKAESGQVIGRSAHAAELRWRADSFNVTTAAAILLYEALRQRQA